ncbi:MAG: DNA-binding protein [Candidatus Aenigmarchaeota archaeon]|nr:DNA-binding protein [Candidatus Aenigmarchaeota archaeon]
MPEINDLQREKEIERIKKIVLSRILTKDANERLARLKLVKPDLANQLELYLVQLYQAGQIKSIINDEQIKNILSQITEKRQFNIRR